MSNKSATEVAQELRHLTQVVARASRNLEAPFMQLSFLGSRHPELRITDRGLVDVMTCSLTDVGRSEMEIEYRHFGCRRAGAGSVTGRRVVTGTQGKGHLRLRQRPAPR